MNDYYDYTKYKLNNGLTVILKKTNTHTVATMLKIKKGSIWEKEGQDGISHFLEHCLAKSGSERYTPERQEEIIGHLIHSNAATKYDSTIFIGDIFSEDLPLWLDFTSDSVFRPKFRENKVELVRGRVEQEIRMRQNLPSYEQGKILKEAMFKVSPLRKFIAGKVETVRKISIDDLKEYHSEGYYPNNAELFLVGGIPDDIEKLIEEAFSDIPMDEVPKISYEKEGKLEHSEKEVYRPELSRAIINMGLLVPDDTHPDYRPFRLMSEILGGNPPTSRLFKRISEKERLTYDIRSNYDSQLREGTITISTDVEYSEVDKTLDLIFEEMQKLKEKGISDAELKREKRTNRYWIEKTFEINADFYNEIGIIYGLDFLERLGISMEDHLEMYRNLTKDDILRVANQYLPSNRKDGSYVLVVGKPGKKLN